MTDNNTNRASQEEIERRQFIQRELASAGISTTRFSHEKDEDIDVIRAIMLANKGQKIPEDLKKKLLAKANMGNESNGVKEDCSYNKGTE